MLGVMGEGGIEKNNELVFHFLRISLKWMSYRGASQAQDCEMSTDPDPLNMFGGLFKTLYKYIYI